MKTNLAYVADPNHKRKYEGDWPTLPKMLHNSAQSFADNLCFTVLDPENPFSMTYKEVLTSVQRLSSMLTHDLNVQAGDNIALCGANSPEWGIAFFAILWSGATVIPLDATASIEKNNSLAKRADVRFVIGDEEFFKEGFGSAYSAHNLCLNKTHPRYILEISARKELAEVPTYNNEQLAAILFTSGTTGMEKGVMLTHRNLVSDAYCLESMVSFTPKDMFYAILPIHHTYCMQSSFITPLTNGASIAFAKGIVISQMMKELALNKITVIAGIPLLFNKLLQGILDGVRKKGAISYGLVRSLMAINALSLNVFNKNVGKKLLGFVLKKANLQGVNLMISGGGPIPPTTIKLFNHLGITCVQGYGLTETSPIVTLNPVNRNKHKSIGLPIDLTDIIIHNVDNDGNGEIAVKGPMVFEGYYHNPEATADAFTSEGYFKTGDLGYIDPDGYVYITGRSKNIIVTEGGKNVSPEEVEDIFQLTPEFEQVLIRGYLANAETQSEGIEALVYPNKDLFKGKSEAEITESILELIRAGNKRLSSYQRIGQVRLLDQPMELTGTKKIRRHTVDKDAGKIIM
ncbi:AMP-dependent synthetase/ligase [Entomospira culicis]|uniref:Long-chain fatty acid--CoA ligase n=1 Tax=Entomospira culicis TaxID=2719989 RepID=A0A968KZ93_9SPIO|nr:AMP-binding protein [Entomospira culicis]NIZ18866.1 long-chain fatty acid--CoA ligase [Entomospira culicis]NIZ69081.1 long-chain fatty acid--CoA ligase [Entomospira culicis]WDI37668.1 AMP-binding protein [Entomospira culicis]WDI39296.1 AMP-binding protein [Entomospira culicis]